MDLVQVPSIVGIPPRSAFSDVDEGRAITTAMLMARGVVRPLPVIFGGRIIGFARGEGVFSDRVFFKKVPAEYRMSWSNYNDIIVSLSSSQRLSRMWHKTATTAPSGSVWYDLWPVSGIPGAGTLAGTAKTANIYDDTSAGTLYCGGNVSSSIKTLLSTWAMSTSTSANSYMIYDRVLDYQSNAYSNTVNQSMTNTNTAQRYNGAGLPGMEMTWGTDTVHNATAENITRVNYTDNTGSNTLMPTTPTIAITVSGAAPTATLGTKIIAPAYVTGTSYGPFLPLASGTTGARAVVDYTTSSNNTGTFVLALVHPIAYVPGTSTQVPNYIDQVYQIPAMERIYDGAAICFMMWSTTTGGVNATGVLDVGWG